MSASDNMFSRLGESIKAYHSTPQAFIPGIAAGALSAGAGALYTQKRKGESSKERALRTIRNAVTSGLIGGVGAQAAAYGLSEAGGAVNSGNPQAGPGFFSSPFMRAVYATPVLALNKWRQNRLQLDSLDKLFPGKLGEKLKHIEIPGRNMSLKLNLPVQIPQTQTGKPANGSQVRKYWSSKFDLLKDKTLNIGGLNSPTMPRVIDQLSRDSNHSWASVFNTNGDEKLAKKYLEKWLAAQGVGQGTGFSLTRAYDKHFNPAKGALMPYQRRIGRAMNPVAAGALMGMPEIVSGLEKLIGVKRTAADTFLPQLPNAGANPEGKPPFWLFRGM